MDTKEGFVSCVSEDTISCIANAINCLNEEPVDFETKPDVLLQKEKFSEESTNFETELRVSPQEEHSSITKQDDLPSTREENILCRLCAGRICDPIYIFGDSGKEMELAKKINSCLPVTVKTTDRLPKQLCSSCISTLNTCYKFSESSLVAERDLNILVHHSQSSVSTVDTEKRIFIEKKNSGHPCPLCAEGMMHKCSPTTEEKSYESHDDKLLQLLEKAISRSEENKENENEAKNRTDTEFIDINIILEKSKSESNININENTIFVCNLCGKCLLTIQQSLQHSKLHSTEFDFPCILCDEKFGNEMELEQHFQLHRVEITKDVTVMESQVYYKCTECDQGFSSRQKYVQHLQIHDGSKQLYCEICDILYETEPELFDHVCQFHCNMIEESCKNCNSLVSSMDTHQCDNQGNRNLKCKQCMKFFLDKMSFEIHMTEHRSTLNNKYKCDNCDTFFSQKLKLTHHMTKVHGITKNSFKQNCNQCIICEQIFLDIKDAMIHTGTHLPNFEPDYSKLRNISISKIYTCEYCEAYFEFPNCVNSHRTQHSGISPYLCTVCHDTFQTFTQLQVHKKIHEEIPGNDTVKSMVPTAYVCGVCEKDFKIWESLYVHRSRYHNGATTTSQYNLFKLNCHICGDICENKNELDIHKKECHKSGEFQCEDCGKILAHLTGLIIHRRQHTGEKPFSCDVCGKKFHQSAGMYTHRRTHTKEYPYHCEICNHGFNVKGDLNNHRRSKHTGERPFKCTICNKAFLTSGVFYQHKMLHAGIKKYKCQFCGAAFSRWNALRLHIRTHTGEKPHHCDICGRGFAQKGDMKKHYRSQHGPKDRRFYCEVCGEGFVRKADMKKHYESYHTMEVI